MCRYPSLVGMHVYHSYNHVAYHIKFKYDAKKQVTTGRKPGSPKQHADEHLDLVGAVAKHPRARTQSVGEEPRSDEDKRGHKLNEPS